MKYFLIFLVVLAVVCFLAYRLFVMTDGDDDA
jgi:hypothetical protein